MLPSRPSRLGGKRMAWRIEGPNYITANPRNGDVWISEGNRVLCFPGVAANRNRLPTIGDIQTLYTSVQSTWHMASSTTDKVVQPIQIGTGEEGFSDGDIKTAQFSSPHGLAVDSDGNVIVADSGNHCIRRIKGGCHSVSTVAGIPREDGWKNGLLDKAIFHFPNGVTTDSKGNTPPHPTPTLSP